jgi:predicted membrane protein
MYSIIQIAAIILFLVSFVIPFMWLWGHVAAIFLFFMASMSARNASRQNEILRELRRHRKTTSQEPNVINLDELYQNFIGNWPFIVTVVLLLIVLLAVAR